MCKEVNKGRRKYILIRVHKAYKGKQQHAVVYMNTSEFYFFVW